MTGTLATAGRGGETPQRASVAALPWLVIVLAAAAFGARAETAGTAAPPPPGKALVYIYREPDFAYAIASASFDIDGVNVAKLNNREYTWFYVPASAHALKIKWGWNYTLKDLLSKDKGVVAVDWKEGRSYFYKLSASVAGIANGTVIDRALASIEPDQALRELAVYRLVPSHNADKLVFNAPLSAAPAEPPRP